jgi:hypothetical protein
MHPPLQMSGEVLNTNVIANRSGIGVPLAATTRITHPWSLSTVKVSFKAQERPNHKETRYQFSIFFIQAAH